VTFGQEQMYLFADPVFYEDVGRWGEESTAFEVTRRATPPGWERLVRGPWIVLRPQGQTMPEQGWKIHASARLDNAERICMAVWDYCVRERVGFKFLHGANVLLAYSSKYAPRASSSKLATIYPADEQEFARILSELGARLEGEDVPYVLSDLRIGNTPLFVRYGGFVERYCPGENGELSPAISRPDGTLVPDRRRPVFEKPDWVPLPAVLTPHLDARSANGGGWLPYQVKKALHFSNGGGVYLARNLGDGAQVVLKEARPLAGLDENRHDAVTRLRRERWALEKLARVDGVPRLLDHLTVGGHEFLVEEYVTGETMLVWQGREHPLVIRDEPTPTELERYTKQALEMHERVTALVGRLHARGVVFGDLHPANLIVRPDGSITLIDFELAHGVDEDLPPGLAAAGFALSDLRGVQRDRYALAALGLWLFFPLNRLLGLDHQLIEGYLDFVAERFPVAPDFMAYLRRELTGPGQPTPTSAGIPLVARLDSPAPDWGTLRRAMAAAILLSATPDREDRLFPGDIRQFSRGGTGFAYGAAGVLWALSVTGCGRYPHHEAWLMDAIRRSSRRDPGFFEGVHGLAYVADHLGYQDEAVQLLNHALVGSTSVRLADFYGGLAGIGLNLLHFAERLGEARFHDAALAAGARLGKLLEVADPGERAHIGLVEPAHGKAGLLRGWSGVALLFLRLYEDTGEECWLERAVRALHRDLDQCVVSAGGSLQVEEPGVRTLTYLEIGSAGIAAVGAEVLAHRADPRIDEALPSLLGACSSEFVLQANLFNGRAGLIAALCLAGHRLGDAGHGVLDRHLRRLAWHGASYRGHLAFPGNQSLRLSMDLATGTAGVLLATHAATVPGAVVLPFLAPARGPAPRSAAAPDPVGPIGPTAPPIPG
jgi:tRNA A-37 threonylcarbamoyl transferase component Bud32